MAGSDAIRVCVVGATGYAGVEAVRLVSAHPCMSLAMATDRKQAGTRLADIYPALAGVSDIVLEQPDPDLIAQQSDVCLLAVPHTASLDLTPQLIERGVSVVDLSADYRLSDPAVYEAWYGVAHTSTELLADAVYGLPEVARDELADLGEKRAAGSAVVVAAPGCYPTATALASLPIVEAGLLASPLVISDCISGVSGAGRTPTARTHFCSAHDSVEAYGVASHRHTPEIEQTLSRAAGNQVNVVFTPHLAPLTRGLLATVYMQVADDVTAASLQRLYEDRYAGEPLVTMLGAGSMPTTSAVAGTARAQVGVALDGRRSNVVVASCAIDNLGKGAAAQAVQCANLICGLPETCGLDFAAPVV